MTIKWNKIEICRKYIFNGREKIKSEELFSLLELALIENRPDFIELFIENNVDMNAFLTEKQLLFLYNCNQVTKIILALRYNNT